MISETSLSHRHTRPPEGMAVILKHDNEIAVVRHVKDPLRGTREADCDIPRETREKKNGHFEPLPVTLNRIMTEEAGIVDWKATGIKPTAYKQIDHVRKDGLLIRGHLVTMESPVALSEVIDTTILDTTEISSIETRSIEHILFDTSDTWRSDPDGRDLIRIAVGEEYFLNQTQNSLMEAADD